MALRSFGRTFAAARLAVVGACAALAVIAACSDFSDEGDITSGDSEASTTDASTTDTSTTDTSTTTDAPITDTSTDAGADNLLENGDFELGCASWSTSGADPALDTTARSGARSCRVCANSTFRYALYGNVPITPVPGAKYVMEAYLRAAPDAAAATSIQATLLVTEGPQGAAVQTGPASSGPALDDTWRYISTLIVVDQDAGTNLKLDLSAGTTGSCFLVDDALLYRAP